MKLTEVHLKNFNGHFNRDLASGKISNHRIVRSQALTESACELCTRAFEQVSSREADEESISRCIVHCHLLSSNI
ncbi:hypothetical protein BDQ17DRAFT_1372529 [Cyathus striatus]|nr:hypothetical protein BDQ17DRAFT_1372529 [Cyathus striatus]